jgi:hypothetical protein
MTYRTHIAATGKSAGNRVKCTAPEGRCPIGGEHIDFHDVKSATQWNFLKNEMYRGADHPEYKNEANDLMKRLEEGGTVTDVEVSSAIEALIDGSKVEKAQPLKKHESPLMYKLDENGELKAEGI